ncbi:hypothetical protein Vafri_6164 [Volvox africanus]|uniref:Uncharacterized protein n=1 Tax=Volvox africanus TaxID=51714 RepID=A0A8J4AXF5_9CHLO|nr:hypothetical protein Vafri_6164 [Volvox africanus]
MLVLGDRVDEELALGPEDMPWQPYNACSGTGGSNDDHHQPLVHRSPLARGSHGMGLERRQIRPEWTRQEEEILVLQHCERGNSWSAIAEHLPGRTAVEVKDIWHGTLRGNNVRSPSLLRAYILELQNHGVSANAREKAYRAARQKIPHDDGTVCKTDYSDITGAGARGAPAAEEEATSSGEASDPAIAQRHTALLGHHVNPQLQPYSSAPTLATGASLRPQVGTLQHVCPGADGHDDAAHQSPSLQRSRPARRKPRSCPQGLTQPQGHTPDKGPQRLQQPLDRPAGSLMPRSRDPRRVVMAANQGGDQSAQLHQRLVDDDLQYSGFAAGCCSGPELDPGTRIPRKRAHSSCDRGLMPAQPAPAPVQPGPAPLSHQVDIAGAAVPHVLPLAPRGAELRPVMLQAEQQPQQQREQVAGDDGPRVKRPRSGQQWLLAEEQSPAVGGGGACWTTTQQRGPHDGEGGRQQHRIVDGEGVPSWRDADEEWAAGTGLKAVMEEAIRNGASSNELAFLQMMWRQSTATMARSGCPQAMLLQQDDGVAAVVAPLPAGARHAGADSPAAALWMPPTKELPLAQRLAEHRLLAEAKALVEAEELYRLTRLRLCLAMQLEAAEEQRNGPPWAAPSSPSVAAPVADRPVAAATGSDDAALYNTTQAAIGRCAPAPATGTATSPATIAADAAGDPIPEVGPPLQRPRNPPGRHEEVLAAAAAAAKVLALQLPARVPLLGGLGGLGPTAASMQPWWAQQQEWPQQKQKQQKHKQELRVDFMRRGRNVSEVLDSGMRMRKVSELVLSPPICSSGAVKGRHPQAPDETRHADDSLHRGHGAAAAAAAAAVAMAMAVPSKAEACHQQSAKRRPDLHENALPNRIGKKQRTKQKPQQIQLRQASMPQQQQVRSRQRQLQRGIPCDYEYDSLGVDALESDVAKALLSFSQFTADPGSSRGAAK